jgi:hypothetical protein
MTYSLALMGWLKRLLLNMSEAGYDCTWIDQYEFVPFFATPSDLRLSYRI